MKRNRLVSLLLCFSMVFALLPGSALAATAIVYNIELTMSKVEVGKPLPTDAQTSATANMEVTSMEWKGDLDANGNAIEGKEYTATIMVELRKDKDAKLGDSVNAKVNGSSTGVSTIRFGTRVRVTYKCTAGQTVTEKPAATPNVLSIKLTMTQPEAGKPLPTTAKTSSTASYEVTNISWSGQLDENGNMAYDTAYTAVFTVEIKEGKNAKFSTAADKEFVKNASINGEYKGFTSAEKVSDTMVKLTYELPAVSRPSTTVSKISISTSAPSAGYAPATSGRTSSTAHTQVTDTKWSGETDSYGLAVAGGVYSYTFTVEIKPGQEYTFSTGTLTATVGGASAQVERVSDTKAIVTYTFPPVEEEVDEAAEAERKRRWSLAEADAQYPKANLFTLVLNENTVDMNAIEELLSVPFAEDRNTFYHAVLNTGVLPTYTALDGTVIDNTGLPRMNERTGDFTTINFRRIDRIVYDLEYPEAWSLGFVDSAKEIWFSPKCDFDTIFRDFEQLLIFNWISTYKTYDYTLFIPDSVFPNGPDYRALNMVSPPGCRVMLYSGDDVYAAARAGKSAARDWCTNHNFNSTPDNFDGTSSMIGTYDRVYTWNTCQTVKRYYYSCNKCGQCEYNPDHTWVGMDLGEDRISAHQYTVKTVSDEHFLGLNAQGDRVYLMCCETCGIDQKQAAMATTYDYYKNVMHMEGDHSYYEYYMEQEKKAWSPGGTAYEMRMKATPEKDYLDGYVVQTGRFVTAKTSGWATQDVQTAASDGLMDSALLGGDFTRTITRLQFCSIAVRMAEEMLGETITPAPADSFTDTSNEYVLKAVTAGITSGVGEGRFDPDGVLNRQQMAAFLYRALQYVKANSDTEYTVYESKLGGYTDAGELADWSRDAMTFMNGLGLINGTGDATLSPNSPCTIEQALLVADRSLDAGGIGWYQYIGTEMGGYGDGGAGCYFVYGERIWCTSSQGDCVAPNGDKAKITLQHFYAIKDR